MQLDMDRTPPLPWGVVLAGGSGRRLEALTAVLSGECVPKQFCRFGRPRSLLEETLHRIRSSVSTERTCVIVRAEHRELAEAQLAAAPGAGLVVQPSDRGTAAGILLPVLHVHHRDPEAIVIIVPSDHAILDVGLFHAGLREACRAVERHPELIVVGGVEADAPRTDFGWILSGTGRRRGDLLPIRPVRRFVEKPPARVARELMRHGALWSTFVLVARTRAIIDLLRRTRPELFRAMEYGFTLASQAREAWVAANYDHLPKADFSSDILEECPDLAVLAWPKTLGWMDLGTPERLLAWLDRMGDGGPRVAVAGLEGGDMRLKSAMV